MDTPACGGGKRNRAISSVELATGEQKEVTRFKLNFGFDPYLLHLHVLAADA
jgi:hypothetical protein